ncbi:MAG: MogA/MoaB family molybdenum cofactor biosynthesis protein [Microlunatus sp.]|nr:MogA/MoaB family molybdenum cofactor biosynthesis protein [Microlunatus sp.]
MTVSTRAAAGVYDDESGPVIAASLSEAGLLVDGPQIVPDGKAFGGALTDAVAHGYDVIITTGGTGLSPTDDTPEQTRPLVDKELPHLSAAITQHGVDQGVPTAVLSRGLAGVAGRSLVINLPGSRGGARDGMAVVQPLLRHAIGQLRGDDHPRPGH